MENKDEEIYDMDIRFYTIKMPMNIPECMLIALLQQATTKDEHLQ